MNLAVRSTLLSLVVVASAQAAAPEISADQKSSLLDIISQRVTRMAFVPGADFSKWPDHLAKHKASIDSAQDNATFAVAVNEALGEFGFSHISVLTPASAEARSTGQQVGIGIYLEITPEGIKIKSVLPDSPADKAGLKPGETIVEVNGVKPTSRSVLEGAPGTVFDMKIKALNGKTRMTKVTRAAFSTRPPIELRWIKPDTAYIKISSFEGATTTNKEAGYNGSRMATLMQEVNAKAKYMVLDVRNNPGGFVMSMQDCAGFFIPKDKPLGTWLTRSIVNRFVKETGKSANDFAALSEWSPAKMFPAKKDVVFTGKLAVLVNGGTGSAAEMISASLQEQANAKVFGTKSIGMVLAAVITPLKEGWQMMIPIQDFITSKGVRLEGRGVIPDTEIKTEPDGVKDPALDAAVKWLGSAKS